MRQVIPRVLIACAVTAAVLMGSAALAQSQEPPRNLTIDDLFLLRSVRDPQVSPEGEWIAFTVTATQLEDDKSETAVYMIPTAGGDALRMTAKGSSASRPRWSPDGKYLSFQSSRDDSQTQVWLLNRLGGEAQQLTEVKQGINSYEWSPDGQRLALVIRDPDPDDETEGDEKTTKDKEKDKPKPHVINRLQFKRDYAGYLDERRNHLYVFDLKDRRLRKITSGDYDDSQPAWSPDGKSIVFVSNRTENPDGNENTDLWIVSPDNTDEGKTLLQLTSNPGSDSQPAWSSDGKWITYVTVTRPEIIWYATRHLAVIPAGGGSANVLTRSLDRRVSDPNFAEDGFIYFLLEDSGETHLARVALDGGNLERPVMGQFEVSSYSLGPDGTVATLISHPDRPGEIHGWRDGSLLQLSHVNDELLSKLKLAEVENVHFPSRDGTEIEGFIYKPPDYNDKLTYPTLLRIHGGPVAQYDFGFNFEAQLFASHGYVVVLTNPRGSSGYGEEFSLGIYRSWGQKDFEDVMAGVDFAIQQGYADPNRLGVGGWSYGGILTNYVITQSDRFQGAISGASEVLYVANYGHDHYQYEWELELGLPWENRDLWERLSPFNSVEKIVTPTLIMGGALDWNVPILNSEQLYQALRRLGRTTQLVVYPGEHHGIRRPSFQKDRLQRYLDWYGRYVKAEPKAADVEAGQE